MNGALTLEAPKPRRQLWMMAGLVAVIGAVAGFAAAREMAEPLALTALFELMLSFTTFAWYCRDSDAVGFRRTRLMSICMIAFSLLSVAVYLVRSRAPGHKGRALLRFAGFLALMLVVMVAGGLAGSLAGAG